MSDTIYSGLYNHPYAGDEVDIDEAARQLVARVGRKTRMCLIHLTVVHPMDNMCQMIEGCSVSEVAVIPLATP